MISGLQMWMMAPQTGIQWMLLAATRHGDCWGAGEMQEAAICHSLRWTRKQDWPQISEIHIRGMNSVSPEAYIFPHKEW